MIAVDSNILIYAHRRDSQWHAPAARRLKELAEGNAPWLIPWPCVHEFLAVVTHPRIYAPASTLEEAVRQVELWRESSTLRMAGESAEYWTSLLRVMRAAKPSGPQIHDARIAAICLDHGVELLWTADRDFSRFSGLRTVNPLVRPD